jgi:catechol 2,3-dioxygenase-like lactoylglutathione lyase family enzyme
LAIKPTLDQINIVSGDPAASIAFYRRLGVDIPDTGIWRTPSGIHHVNSTKQTVEGPGSLEIDSTAFAQLWNPGWKGRDDLHGRIVIGFHVPTRDAVDAVFRDMTGAGHRGLVEPWDAFWGARYAMLEDPDGIAVGIMSPVSDDKRSPPPQV